MHYNIHSGGICIIICIQSCFRLNNYSHTLSIGVCVVFVFGMVSSVTLVGPGYYYCKWLQDAHVNWPVLCKCYIHNIDNVVHVYYLTVIVV